MGYPDNVTAPSIVRQVKESLEINTLTSQDVHIVAWPWTSPASLGNYIQTASTVALPGTTTVVIPAVSVYTPAAGVAPLLSVAPNLGLNLPDQMQSGRGRLVGMGIELLNVTAPLNRSGTIYCWRLPGIQKNDEVLQYLTAGALTRVGKYRRVGTPPTTPASAMLIPGTRSWASEQGAYLVCPMEMDNPPLYPTQDSPLLQPLGQELDVDDVNLGPVVTGNAVSTSPANRLTPFNLTGVIATGNNPLSKFTLNVVWYYEDFPGVDSDLLTLAKPSCEDDPLALRLYAEVLNTLPVAVPSSWNAAGDWWWDVVTAIKDHAADIGGMIGGAPGKALGVAASSLAGWAQGRYMTAPGSGGSGVPQKKPKARAQKNPPGPKPGKGQQQQQVKKKDVRVLVVEPQAAAKAALIRKMRAENRKKQIAAARAYDARVLALGL